jgi:hypothetical protein
MSAAQIGGMIGAAIGLANFVGLRWLADRIDSGRDPGDGRGPGKANILRMVAIADLIVFPLLGYFVGPLVAGRT